MLQEKLDETEKKMTEVNRIAKLALINMVIAIIVTLVLYTIQPITALVSGPIFLIFFMLNSEAQIMHSVHKMNVFILEIYLKEISVLNKVKNHNIEGLSVEDAVQFRKEVMGSDSFKTLRTDLALISHKNVENKVQEIEKTTMELIVNYPEGPIYKLGSRIFGKSSEK